MARIDMQTLVRKVAAMNEAAGYPADGWRRPGTAAVGALCLEADASGYAVSRLATEGGATTRLYGHAWHRQEDIEEVR